MDNQILIIDNHPAVRMTVRHLLENEGCTIVGEADNSTDALRLTHARQPDTLVLGIGSPNVDDLSFIHQLTALRLPVKIIVLTARESSNIAIHCMRAGAHGFVNKHQDLFELVKAIGAANLLGQKALSWTCIDLPQQGQEAFFKKLSKRELNVLQKLSQGLSSQQIAERMSLSKKTIIACKARLLVKLNACHYQDYIR
ncbi:response regulator transcription factor [Pseudomonas yamanorum]|uniref:response regulator transcription factor n=1 Tax=Pseudomonas yamanorum TaxID=515393 RepID=UPI00087C518A|nr:response regulator transcription factor [Pseudomonas yamanorum]SDT99263.1 two-component system, NarL family, response regulator EvgA [Pseudomonas yamanorum]